MRRFALVAVAVALAVALAACGDKPGAPDDCERAYAKLAPVMESVAGRKLAADDRARSLAECRARVADHSDDALVPCVLAAIDDAAVKACLKLAVDPSKIPRKKTEARIALDKLQRAAKVYYVTNGAYPAGSAATLPATPCCAGSGGLCAADAAAWQADPAWAALHFSIGEPGHYQYSYTSDGHSLVATATGDPDCSGSAASYTLHMAWDGRNPTAKITEPF